MKKIIVVLVMFILSFGVFAQQSDSIKFESSTFTQVEAYGLSIQNQSFIPTMDVYVSHKFSEHWALSAFGLTTDTWAEVYTGIEYSPVDWLVTGLSLGIETAPAFWRIAANIGIYTKHFVSTTCFEYGGSGYWYDIQAKSVFARDIISLGVMARRFHGVGPRVDIAIPKTSINLWFSGLYIQGDFLGSGPTANYGAAYGLYVKF
jgi:hypothetical protein